MLLVAALSAALTLACSDQADEAVKAFGQGIYIPAHWQQTREIEGHRVHVVQEKVACSSCHELTDKTIGPVTPEKCASCHEKEAALRHATKEARARFGDDVNTDCRSCHVFTLHPTDTGPHTALSGPYEAKDCLRCHASTQGDLAPVIVHRPAGCENCHQPHEQDHPVSAPCEGCHEDVSTTHASKGKTTLETCTTCHQSQHATAETARETCSTCHANEKPIIPATALFEDGHRECIGCHRPHDFEKSAAVDCKSCHEDKPVLAEARVAPHRQCTSCHKPHDVKSASATACANCHKNISPNHPKHGKAGTCTGCHDPHPTSRTSVKVRDCSSCHHEAAHDDSFHEGVACRSCHQPHQFLLANAGAALCAQCHSQNVQEVTAHKGHKACTSCHTGLPHHPDRRDAPCSSCHQSIQSKALEGHSDCQSCHDPHGTQLDKQCGDCHAKEHRTAPRGHQTCTSCHDQHSGAQQVTGCASCHKQEAKTPHGQLSADCSNCHRPHGPTGLARPPTCSTCHQAGSGPGLHTVKAHNDCAQCHTQHGELQSPQRPACLSCHQNKKKHFPEANACSSCHLFATTR